MALALFFLSCASVPQEVPPELYWPFPPEKPRIKFVDLIMGSIDVTGARTSKFNQFMFGEEVEVTFRRPSFVTAKEDVIFVTDFNRVHIYDFRKRKFRTVGANVLGNATGIAIGPDGLLYIGDSGKRRVFAFDVRRLKAKTIGTAYTFLTPGGVTIDEPRQRLIVADAKRHTVTVWTLDGKFLFGIGKKGVAPGEFNIPYDVAVDAQGHIYVLDSGNFRVQVFDDKGRAILIFGGLGMSPGLFARPKGIALDSDGNIYVVDAAFGNFQIFDPRGHFLLSVGTNGTEPGKFVLPSDIFIDKNDKIYVVDQMNRRVQIFQYLK